MPPVMVALLAAVATAMSALVPFAHGLLILVLILVAAAAAGLVALCASVAQSPIQGHAVLDQKSNWSGAALAG